MLVPRGFLGVVGCVAAWVPCRTHLASPRWLSASALVAQKVGIVAIASPSPYTAPHPLALAMGTTAANLDADGNHYAEGTKYH